MKNKYLIENMENTMISAITSPRAGDVLIEILTSNPIGGLLLVFRGDAETEKKIMKKTDSAVKFLSNLLVMFVKNAAEVRSKKPDLVPTKRSTLEETLKPVVTITGLWVKSKDEDAEFGFDGDDVATCFAAQANLAKEVAEAAKAAALYAACLVEHAQDILSGTSVCGAEYSNYIAELHDVEVALNNLKNAC